MNSISSINDLKLQELRAFALEYVKQIVAKASELAQERQEAKNAYKMAQLAGGDANAIKLAKPDELAANCRPLTRGQQLRAAAAQIDNKFQRKLIHADFAWPVFGASRELRKRRKSGAGKQSDNNDTQAAATAEARAHARLAGACEEPHDTIGAHQRQRPDDSGAPFNRASWSQLLACFSTCLPEALTRSMPPSKSPAARGEGMRMSKRDTRGH